MNRIQFYLLFACICLFGCGTINEASKQKLDAGRYQLKGLGQRQYFTHAADDTITLYPVSKQAIGWVADTAKAGIVHLLATQAKASKRIVFLKQQLTFDILSILLKYRPATEGFPNQLTTNFNAAGYVGHKTDRYILTYGRNPLGQYSRTIRHFAYSFGAFAGLGAPEITPSVTHDSVQIDYYGVALTTGIGGMLSVGSLTFGLGLGFDHLLDKNHKLWIYNGKPWLGLTVGLSFF